MKFESDTEIDRLLRRHARRKATAASSTPENAHAARDNESAALSGAVGIHLDADEMNAYAEGALPAASRSRYASHLADCDECRSLVTKLTLAANVAVASRDERTKDAASTSRSWRDWLAALFTPTVLRYGVPALALMAVIVVALVAMRGQRNTDLVAQNEQGRNTSVKPEISEEEQHADAPSTGTSAAPVGAPSLNANSGAVVNNQSQADTIVPAPSPTQAKGGEAEQQSAPAPQNAPKPAEQERSSGGMLGNTATDRSDRDEAVTMAQQPPPPVNTVPAAKAPAEADATVTEEVTQKSAGGLGRNKTATPAPGTSNNNYTTDGVESRTQEDAKNRAPESGKREGPAARRSRSADKPAGAATASRAYKDDEGAETKSAGGRQFRRQGGAWVDTAYNSSRSTTNVARGSEQYRALVADEPGIASIADQLGGTIILVWKKRAYRIY